MSKLSTKNVKKTSNESYIPKLLEPGNVEAKINGIRLDQPDWLKKDDAYHVILDLEGRKPSDDFEGFLIDYNDPTKGNHTGQIARVKAGNWPYKDFHRPAENGKEELNIKRDDEILKFLLNLVEAIGPAAENWWDSVDNKYDTIQEFVEGFNNDKPFDGIFLNWCLAGRQYTKQNGYKAWDLFLPKFSRAGIPFESFNAVKKRLLTFDEKEHTEIQEPKDVEDFGDEVADIQDATDITLEDATEFDL
jgi:hypothetical protein